ncbi:ARM repeat-containing protein [Sporormia fimetaria CBS 119925]|uniref:ARM repeat-containing protein n=1 Tax=Sporormia fimetaria CBS 119925 TaxID=1340428 RepID=A0A6A6UZ05_9PLEO|nr:ARM repeat-containing protein [Sporormia fimetaria CBS 119925]
MESNLTRHMPAFATSSRARELNGTLTLNGSTKDRSTASHDFEPSADIWNTPRNSMFEPSTQSTLRNRDNTSDLFENSVGLGSRNHRWENASVWNYSSNIGQGRPTLPSPPRRRSLAQVQPTQQVGPVSSLLPTSRPSNVQQVAHPDSTKSRLDPTSSDFTSFQNGNNRANGFGSFAFTPTDSIGLRQDASISPWSGTPSAHSPSGDRRSIATDYFGHSSGAPSQSGSLPPSRHGEPVSFSSDGDSLANAFQAYPRQTSSFSNPSGRPFAERSGSMQSDRLPFVRFPVEQNFSTAVAPSRPSIGSNGLYSMPQIDHSYGQNGALDKTDWTYAQPGTYTPDFSQPPSDTAIRFRPVNFDNRSTANSTGARQSPHYSNVHTPAKVDRSYPSRADDGLELGLVQSKLAGYQLQQQQQLQKHPQLQFDRRHMNNADYSVQPFVPQAMPTNITVNHLRNAHYYTQNALNMPSFATNSPFAVVPQSLPVDTVPMMVPPRGPREHMPYLDTCSALLKQFRTLSPAQRERWPLERIYGHIVEFAVDQNGSRFIQSKLRDAREEKRTVFAEMQNDVFKLMKDVYGNYVIQNFFQYGDQSQKRFLVKRMEGHVVELSQDTYACRVVQTALQYILTDQQTQLVGELNGHVLELVQNQNGNHVIQQAVQQVPPEHISFIIEAFRGRVGDLAHHQYGCRVIQRMLEYCAPPVKRFILDELHPVAGGLIADQFGNYVTQHIIVHGEDQDRERLIPLVLGDLLRFCKHKHASNVVETCIEYGIKQNEKNPDVFEILRRVTEPGPNGDIPLSSLIRDSYGNYVINKLLLWLPEPEYRQFDATVKQKLREIKESGTAAANSKQVVALDKKLALMPAERATRAEKERRSQVQRTSISSSADSVPEPPMLVSDVPSPQSSSLPSGNVSTRGDPVQSEKTPTTATAIEIQNFQ